MTTVFVSDDTLANDSRLSGRHRALYLAPLGQRRRASRSPEITLTKNSFTLASISSRQHYATAHPCVWMRTWSKPLLRARRARADHALAVQPVMINPTAPMRRYTQQLIELLGRLRLQALSPSIMQCSHLRLHRTQRHGDVVVVDQAWHCVRRPRKSRSSDPHRATSTR